MTLTVSLRTQEACVSAQVASRLPVNGTVLAVLTGPAGLRSQRPVKHVSLFFSITEFVSFNSSSVF